MKQKVLLILVDGMRPDGIKKCGNSYLTELAGKGASNMAAKTVMPSITLPCHTSLFFSTPPERHGITTNTWNPMVRPIESLFDLISSCGGKCASFYNWEELRDLARPGSLAYSSYRSMYFHPHSDRLLTEEAIWYINRYSPDFTFLYLGETDEDGHAHGWMSEKYLSTVAGASECIRDIVGSLPEEYTVIVTADHGGHDRSHGSDMPEDMTIPMIMKGPAFACGSTLKDACIMDIAPTVAKLMELHIPQYWEGKTLL